VLFQGKEKEERRVIESVWVGIIPNVLRNKWGIGSRECKITWHVSWWPPGGDMRWGKGKAN
jgi:hypothetical protein